MSLCKVTNRKRPLWVASKPDLTRPYLAWLLACHGGRFWLSLQRHWEDPCSDRLKRNQEALELTARETRRLSWASWVGTGSEARSSPFYISYTAPRGRRCERAVVVPSRLLPASEAVREKSETQKEKEDRDTYFSSKESQSSLEGHAYSLLTQAKGYRNALQGVFEDWALAGEEEEGIEVLWVSLL